MKSEHKIIIAVIVVTVLTFFGLVWLMDKVQTPEVVSQEYLVGNNPHTKGASEEEAILTIVEFSDFQCPACRAAYPLIDTFVADNPDSVRLVFRHFPLVSIHLNARKAAIASEIVAEEGLFWEFHNLLFTNQMEWAQVSDPTDLFVAYAESLDFDGERLRENMSSSIYDQLVRDDQVIAHDLNLNSTPTFFFNGKLHRGVPTVDILYDYLAEAQ